MTGDVARATAWLDRLAEAHEAANRGPWGVVGKIGIIPDATAIVAEHNAMGPLLALARGVAELRDDLRRDSARYLGRVQRGGYDDGAIRAYDHIADKLTDLLADAAPDEEAR